MMKIFQSFLISAVFGLLCFGILFLSVRGNHGNPTPEELNTNYWKDDGPLELSPERGRFALLFSIVEDKSFSFSLPIARFTTPDLGYSNGKYVSLFAPGVSFLVMPGYIIGKYFGASQVGTYLTVSLFAVFNAILIVWIARLLGAKVIAGIIAGIIFLFATPAYAYGVTLYQHHISTFLILLSIYLLLRFTSLWVLFIVWFLIACSIPIDYPNLFLMAPIAVFSFLRFFELKRKYDGYWFTVKLGGFFTILTALIPVLFFLWFNMQSYGNPFQLSGTLPSVKAIDELGNPTFPHDAGTDKNKDFFTDPTKQKKSAIGFFKTRNMIRGLYTHLISPDRGIIVYAPIVLIGLFALPFLYKQYPSALQVLFGVAGMNLLFYSLWGDPWGGWAFGSRYLIPSYAVLSICIGIVLTLWSKRVVLLVFIFLLIVYGVGINTLGVLTSSRNPSKIEILSLERITGREEKYTFERNWDFLQAGRTKSYVYQTFLRERMVPMTYYWIIVSGIVFLTYWLFVVLHLKSRKG
ncbi:MAG: hypothetical protein N3A54_02840 [Patescibacteria group bacterium]|nr:hypothetical protein [Patescibacteria group bacterium]